MLIGVDLILQKVNSNAVSSFEDEEKLWFLNEEQIAYIKQTINPKSNPKGLGLQDGQKRYDDLENLITSASLDVYARDNDSVYAFLPANYMHLISDSSKVKDLCGATYAPSTVSSVFYSAKYQLPTNSYDLFKTLLVKINGNTVVDVSAYYPDGIPSNTSKFELLNIILELFNSVSGFEAKYEKYKDISNPGGIVIVSNSSFTLSNVYKSGVSTTTTQVFTIDTNTLTKIQNSLGIIESPNRLCKTEDIKTLLKSNFSTTFVDSPISSLQQFKLNAYHKKNFIISQLNIDYIRKPKKISLILNQDCELNENVHQEIVNNTAKRLAAYTFNSGYNNIINENLLKE